MKQLIPAVGLCLATLSLWSVPVSSPLAADAAANYPHRPVRVISGSPGSTADITARFIGHKLGERLKQQFVIDNRASAGGIVGAEIVANAPPDGQTLYVTGVNTQVSAPLLFKKIPFDPLKDFAPITIVSAVDAAIEAGRSGLP